jgi:hypothetical protein
MNQTVLNRSRSDKFAFVLELPKVLKQQQDIVLQKEYNADTIQFTTFGSPVPTITVPEVKVPFGGQVYNTSSISRPAYPPISLRFLVDNGYQNYWILWKWLNLFNDNKEGTTNLNAPLNSKKDDIILTNPIVDYAANFTLFGLDEFNNKIISFNYTQAFITGLSPIEFSFQNPAEITCTATFVFNQLRVDLIKDINVSSC